MGRAVIESRAHQLLHGYRSGHGQIAASIKLAERDSDLVTRLSDLSGALSSGLQLDPYLTFYPLPSRKFFAIARTWADPEASRAGCVMTHTILIPTDWWASLSNVRSLSLLFRNPRSDPEYNFGEPIDLSERSHTPAPQKIKIDLPSSGAFVDRYFGQGLRPVVWFNAGEPEEYVWRLVEHLWPKLRSVFSCCTFSLQPRTLQEGPFDLLFAPSSVYSRFAKLSIDHLIDSGPERNAKPQPLEPWCENWAKTLFSSDVGLPSSESELPIWTELGEDPTAIRKLSLVHELRLRADQSPNAGVGAIDVVESLAHDPDAAMALKRLVFSDAINAAASADSAEKGLATLRLIEDRLHRDSFRKISDDFEKRLSSAAQKMTVRVPEAALQIGGTALSNSGTGSGSAFVQGLMLGFRELAHSDPSKLVVLRSHPDVAAELFRSEPTFAATYLQLGGESAQKIVSGWLTSTRDVETLRLVRKSVLPVLKELDDEELLSPLLRDIPERDVKETLNILSSVSNGFSTRVTRSVVADRISSVFPELVKRWARDTRDWSIGAAVIVGAAYPHSRQGFIELLEQRELVGERRAEVLVAMITDQKSSNSPYWLRELMSEDVRLIETFLHASSYMSDFIEAGLSRLLSDAPYPKLANSAELLNSVLQFEGRGVFPQLLDSAMRTVITSYASEGPDFSEARAFLEHPAAIQWLQNTSESQLIALFVQMRDSAPEGAARAWKLVAEAPSALYQRCPSVLPRVCDSLVSYARQSYPEGIQNSLRTVLQRSGSEAGADTRQVLSAKLLRFAFDNVNLSLGAVVAEAFADVYSAAIAENTRPSSILAVLFGSYDWDKGKDLRRNLVDAFLRSNWAPGDLAVAANNAGILRKIFKRLHRSSKGDSYIRAMSQDLSQRSDSSAVRARESLDPLVAEPDFYEEWD
jgi:hypothetical protein